MEDRSRDPLHRSGWMAVATTRDVEVLNDLIEATLDSAECYREAADRACARKFKELFAERAAERRRVVEMLQSRVRALGGEPEGRGSLLAKAERMLLDLKDSVSGKGDRAIIREVESGEDHIKARYEKALRQDIAPALRHVIADLYARIEADHDEVSELKHHRGRAATKA